MRLFLDLSYWFIIASVVFAVAGQIICHRWFLQT